MGNAAFSPQRRTLRSPRIARMTQQISPQQTWTKPELVRLGTIKDVAGPTGAGAQASGGGQFRS